MIATSKLEVPYLADDSTELVDGVESNFVMVSVIVGAQKLGVERVQGLKKKNIYIYIYRRFNAIVSQLKMHYFSGGAFESLISSQLLNKEKYI